MSKKEELTEQQLAVLNENYPVSTDENRNSYPRFGMLSQDITEESGTGKNKKIKVIESAGTFYTEKDLGEVNEDGKKVWTREYIEGEGVDVIIAFHRYQLRKYDSSLNKFINTPIYDNSDQVLPLYLDGQKIKTGTESSLQTMYPALTQKGKPTSDLKKNTILYVVYNDELYQLNLSISSGWSFSSYKRTINPSTVLTTLSSTEETFGSNTYRKMSFTQKRRIDPEEFELVVEKQTVLRTNVENDSKLYLPSGEITDEDMDKFAKVNNVFIPSPLRRVGI